MSGDTHARLVETILKDARGEPEADDLLEKIKELREHKVPLSEIERSLRSKYDAYDYAEVAIPVTGDAVGVRTTRGGVVIGRAVTPAKNPNGLFTISDPRIGTHVDDFTPPAEVCDAPRVTQKDDHMAVLMYDPDTPPGEAGSLHRLGGVTVLKTGPIIDPTELLPDATQPPEVDA